MANEKPAPSPLDQLAQQTIALHVMASALVAQTEGLVMAVRALQIQADSVAAVSNGALTREQLMTGKGDKKRPSTFGGSQSEEVT